MKTEAASPNTHTFSFMTHREVLIWRMKCHGADTMRKTAKTRLESNNNKTNILKYQHGSCKTSFTTIPHHKYQNLPTTRPGPFVQKYRADGKKVRAQLFFFLFIIQHLTQKEWRITSTRRHYGFNTRLRSETSALNTQSTNPASTWAEINQELSLKLTY